MSTPTHQHTNTQMQRYICNIHWKRRWIPWKAAHRNDRSQRMSSCVNSRDQLLRCHTHLSKDGAGKAQHWMLKTVAATTATPISAISTDLCGWMDGRMDGFAYIACGARDVNHKTQGTESGFHSKYQFGWQVHLLCTEHSFRLYLLICRSFVHYLLCNESAVSFFPFIIWILVCVA